MSVGVRCSGTGLVGQRLEKPGWR